MPADGRASITIEAVTRDELQRAVPQAACFVVPRVVVLGRVPPQPPRRRARLDDADARASGWRSSSPRDVAPQEIRDCLHEELAQALGPLNDLYRLTDSVFNDDNFHTVLTGFDMLMLRASTRPSCTAA